MWIYILIILFIAYLAYQELNGVSLSKSGLLFALGGLCLFVGLSDMLGGYDRYIYADLFDNVADVINSGSSNFKDAYIFDIYSSEFGYCWLNVLIGYITRNRYIFILLLTIIIYVNIYNILQKYTQNYAFALLIFMGFWFFFTFTYLRQVLAATFAWYSIKYILNRDLKRFIAVMVLASSFHNSAIIFFPLYFIPIIKFKRDVIIYIAVVMFLLGLSGLPSSLYEAYGEASGSLARAHGYSGDSNARWAYLIEAFVILLFIFRNYDALFQSKLQTLMTNMAIIFALILVFFYNSENGGRLTWFYMIGVFGTMSNLASSNIPNKSDKNFVLVLCIVLYIRIVLSWGILLYPYKTFLTPGVREGDLVEKIYEYDHGYDNDKFYR